MHSIPELEQRLANVVASASGEPVRGQFAISAFRQSIARTLSDFREDQQAHGLSADTPFFDLVIFDANSAESAIFLVPMFFEDSLRIFVGCGVPNEVIRMTNQFAMTDVDDMTVALRERGVVHELAIPRSLAEYWLTAS